MENGQETMACCLRRYKNENDSMVAKWCYKRRLQLVFSHSLPVHLTFHALALPFLGATDKEGAAVCRGDNYKVNG